MSSSKIKNLLIAALALLNLLFLTVIIIDRTAEAVYRRETTQNACAVLEAAGVSVSADDIQDSDGQVTMRAARKIGAEAVIAAAALGETRVRENGVVYSYENDERGTAIFSSGGEFEINLNDGVIEAEGGTLQTARRLLRKMQLETSELYLSGRPGQETVTAVVAYKKSSIFNCVISFEFSEGSLVTIEGRYITGVEPAAEGEEISAAPTALLTFLESVKSGAITCTRIDSVESGYQRREVGAFGEAIITPAWQITCDSGRYLLDTTTGEIRQLAPVIG